jgi:hypothetical protein
MSIRHQHSGQERHVARQQPEAGIDVAAESLSEAVDNREIVHAASSMLEARLRRPWQEVPPR